MNRGKTIYLFVLLVAVIPICVFGIITWSESRLQELPILGEENHVITNFQFRDQNNQLFGKNSWKGNIVVANFFFTSCPAICPKMVGQLKRVQASTGSHLEFSSFTVDPERDSVQKLNAYAKRMGIGANWHLLTGNKIDLYRFARKDLMIIATDGDGGPADFIHSDNLVLIDPSGRIRGYYKGTDEEEVNNLIRDIGRLKTEYNL